MLNETIERDDAVGHKIVEIKCKVELLEDGFNYAEAVVILDNGVAFSVDSKGVDGPTELTACIELRDYEQSSILVPQVDRIVGRVITNVVVTNCIPTLVVIVGQNALYGIDGGPPFNSFGPVVSRVGECMGGDEIVDFWTRRPVSVQVLTYLYLP